ncbi:MAG: prepilin-type N-terminal cleavage/methylation domain-containing protein [Candidatus Omnitrophica bacterium]|nr:prepilin-type N-terminal cleavage/methylation domain-containing protein [Candidatus Omnitrophota bacterium]
MRKGFTLLELLVVIVIIGILASIAIPNYQGMVEKSKADQAKTYLKVIRTGEKIYYANNTSYTACGGAVDIKSKLGAEITEENYTFSVTSSAETTFLATAARNSDGKTITIDQDGAIGGDSPYK